jgi:protease-4
LAFANLTEQKSARRWKVGIRVAWLVFLAVVFWQLFSYSSPTSNPTMPHTAMVSIVGEIGSETEASAENVMTSMRLALEDSGSQAVVEESCASAAYYIAAATDQIYVDKASIVGSIGVLMDGFGFTELMNKLGVERRLMTAGANKGFLDPFSPQTEPQRKHAQAMLDQIHTQFIDAVKKGRGDRLKETPEMFSGLFWSGQQAVDLGLADSLGSLDGVAREVVKAPDVIDYTQRENVAERLVKRFGAAIGEGSVRALRNTTGLR